MTNDRWVLRTNPLLPRSASPSQRGTKFAVRVRMEPLQSRSDPRPPSARTPPTFRRAAGLLAVVLIVAFGALLAWLSREQTLVAAAASLVEHSNGQIALDRLSGSLLRPIHVDHAVLKNGRYEFVLENTTFRWSPLWLLAGVVAFEPVSVE